MKRILIAVAILLSIPILLFGAIVLFAGVWITIKGVDVPPPDTYDLVPKRVQVSDDENAYTYFVAAMNALDLPADSDRLYDILDGTVQDDEFVRDIIAKNAESLELIERGLVCRTCQAPEVAGIEDTAPYAGELRGIVRIMALRAMCQRHKGEYAKSANSCIQLLRFGVMLRDNAECLVDYLVGTAVLETGLEQSRQLAYDPGPTADQLAGLPEQLDRLLPFGNGLVRALKAEFQLTTNAIDDIHAGKFHSDDPGCAGPKCFLPHFCRRIPTYILQPNKTNLMFADYFRGAIKNAPHCYADMNLHDAESIMDERKLSRFANMVRPNVVGRTLYSLFLSSIDAVLAAKCRAECSVQATRLIFACRAYEKHTGELPDSLDALVPKFIDRVPTDPFDGKPFRYSREKCIVYSVATDLKDSGGSTKHPYYEAESGPHRKHWYGEDFVFAIK